MSGLSVYLLISIGSFEMCKITVSQSSMCFLALGDPIERCPSPIYYVRVDLFAPRNGKKPLLAEDS